MRPSVKDPHPLIAVAPELVARYPVDDIELPATWDDDLTGKPAFLGTDPGRLPDDIDERGFRTMMAHYFALITHIDDQVGRLLERLETLGQTERTVVVFFSDHGEMLGEHRAIQKRLFYEASVRVPCVLSWPGTLPAGHRVTTPVGGVDLAPTLLEWAGLSFDGAVDGRSIAAPVAAGRQPAPLPVLSEVGTSDGINFRSTAPEDLAARVMLRDADFKLNWNRTDLDELYDLAADPDERVNLIEAREHQERSARMRRTVRDIVRRTGPGYYDWCVGD